MTWYDTLNKYYVASSRNYEMIFHPITSLCINRYYYYYITQNLLEKITLNGSHCQVGISLSLFTTMEQTDGKENILINLRVEKFVSLMLGEKQKQETKSGAGNCRKSLCSCLCFCKAYGIVKNAIRRTFQTTAHRQRLCHENKCTFVKQTTNFNVLLTTKDTQFWLPYLAGDVNTTKQAIRSCQFPA